MGYNPKETVIITNETKKPGKDIVPVISCKGVMANQRTTTTTAATKPIGNATNFSIQGEGALSDFHNVSGVKSDELGIAPKCKRMCSALLWPPNNVYMVSEKYVNSFILSSFYDFQGNFS